MGGRKYRKTIYAVAAALIMSTCTMPVMAAPYSTGDKTLTAVSSDQTYAQGLDTAARIITSVELDKRSPYENTGIAVTDTYLNIYKKASTKSDVIGKLNNGSGCEILDSTRKWYHIQSGKCEGYVAKKSVVTGYAAQLYAEENNITGLVARSQQNAEEYLYKEPSSDSDIVATVMWDEDVEIIGETNDHTWVRVKIGDNEGYLQASSIILDVQYEEAIASEPASETQTAVVTAVSADAAAAPAQNATQTQAETQTAQVEATAQTQETQAVQADAAAQTQETQAAETQAAQTQEEVQETQAPESQEAVAAEETEAAETEAAAVNVTDTDETVYATYSVSIRASYSTDGELLGCLPGGEGVRRTGVCDNGWSRVEYNGTTAYIKSDYLTTEEPVEVETEAEDTDTDSQTEESTDTQDQADEQTQPDAQIQISEADASVSSDAGGSTLYASTDVYIREEASSESDIIGGLSSGESVTVVSSADGWSCVSINGYTGYVCSDYLTSQQPVTEDTSDEQSDDSAEQTDTATDQSSEAEISQEDSQDESDGSEIVEERNETVYAISGVNIRSGANKDTDKLGALTTGQSVTRTGICSNGWSQVAYNGSIGYINSNYLTTDKPAVTTDSSTTAVATSDSSSLGSQIASFAQQYVGYPYVYGGNSLTNGVDCSGFTQQVYLKFGYSIPRTAASQAGAGSSVSLSNLQPGDLIFYGSSSYIGHVAIYIGDGMIVHASTPTKGIIISNYNYRTPVCARRII